MEPWCSVTCSFALKTLLWQKYRDPTIPADSLFLFHTGFMWATAEKVKVGPSASQWVQASTNKKEKKNQRKEPTSKFPLDKHTRGEEFLKNSALLSDQKISFLLVLCFCSSSRKLKTVIFFRYNLCTWGFRKKRQYPGRWTPFCCWTS